MAERSGVLEPTLTAYDKKVLKALPDPDSDGACKGDGLDIWDVGRELNETDLKELLRILNGLEHFGLAFSFGGRTGSRADRWERTAKSNAALGEGLSP
jgi:hypothetical protein